MLLERLFAGFSLPDSAENEYLMRAVMRVIGFVGSAIAPVSGVCTHALAGMLMEVCKNPKNPGFNHYLFEVRAWAWGWGCLCMACIAVVVHVDGCACERSGKQ